MALLDSMFGQTPSYFGGLLGEDELSRLRQQAQEQGTLNTAMALLQAGAPSRTPGGGALAIAQGLQQGQQAYRQALNQGLQEKMAGLQIQDLMRKRQEEEAVRRFLPQIMQPGQVEQNWQSPDQIGQYFQTGAIPTQRGPSTINREALQQLALAAPEQFGKLSASLKALQPEYKEAGGVLYEIPTYGGAPTVVGGKPKEDIAGAVKEAMQVLGIDKTIAELTPQDRTAIGNYIDRKESMKTPKVQVDLKDPTAVAQAQSKVLADYTGVLNNAKVGETADRYLQAVNAVKLASQGNKAADGALIYAIGKIYDPSGAVQEGDKATIVGNRSIPETVKGLANKAFKGESLLPSERKKLLDMAQSIVESKSRNIEKIRQPYVELSKSFGGTGNLLRNPLDEAISERGTLDNILGGQ
jgi:surface antigen